VGDYEPFTASNGTAERLGRSPNQRGNALTPALLADASPQWLTPMARLQLFGQLPARCGRPGDNVLVTPRRAAWGRRFSSCWACSSAADRGNGMGKT
jgi:hypothetical protein